MPNCLTDNDVLAYVEHRLSAQDIAALHVHIDRCEQCRVLLSEVARTGPASPPARASAPERVIIRDGRVTTPAELAREAARRAPAPPREPQVGDVVGDRYTLERFLGEGGTSVVWEASLAGTGQRVALKLLKSENPEAARRFSREARVTAALRHEHIVQVHETFVVPESNTMVMAMELLDGFSLARVLKRRDPPGPLPVRETVRILKPVVEAVEAAHAVGVVHRDLKPENIFLLGDGREASLRSPRVKVLDFGLAKLTANEGETAASAKLTQEGMVVGTPHYMAPEQVLSGIEVNHTTDVWALGVITYECLAGVRPIEQSSLTRILRAIATPKIVPLAERAPHVPRAMATLVGKMLSKPQADRPSLLEIRRTLARLDKDR
ncbi:Serine/threonine protein kinase PrkC, regulator of stationary phase [Labilithrix luteola]|uniref:Serine/threonine protein kinase PrkC, regulator of stationary phase n=1 Tax=Labilithrix luteola TaxID=1391654 RepID=A0A0K1PZ69_9BACT|nr:serine/threonine-protein kinase [Labilithrix luteola]AKU98782.1 Serine/threonine protein kinase PrkC, regulator of stationary phase [Labilithrix luteola]